jgi:hypothetical protein
MSSQGHDAAPEKERKKERGMTPHRLNFKALHCFLALFYML